MFPSQLVILLFAQVIFCSQRQKVQSLVSSQPGPFVFALSSDITYKPLVPVTQEPEEDTSRRQELFKNFYKVELASGVALAAPDTRMEVKSQPAKVVKSQQANQTKTVLPMQATRSETPVADELQGINILEDFDLGPRWHKHYLSHCESRVSVFNVPHDNIRDVLRVMIKFGPITEAWMIKDSPYGRPNIVLIEYANIADAGLAILQAVKI